MDDDVDDDKGKAATIPSTGKVAHVSNDPWALLSDSDSNSAVEKCIDTEDLENFSGAMNIEKFDPIKLYAAVLGEDNTEKTLTEQDDYCYASAVAKEKILSKNDNEPSTSSVITGGEAADEWISLESAVDEAFASFSSTSNTGPLLYEPVEFAESGEKLSGIERVSYDIDSVVVACISLFPFKNAMPVPLHLNATEEAVLSKQSKMIACLQVMHKDPQYKYQEYYCVKFAGYGTETIDLYFQFRADQKANTLARLADLRKKAKWELMEHIIVPALNDLSDECMTKVRNNVGLLKNREFLMTGHECKFRVYPEDWPTFAKNIDEYLNLAIEKRILSLTTNVIFVHCCHGMKGRPADTVHELENFFNPRHPDVLILQVHAANILWPCADEGLFVRVAQLARVLGTKSKITFYQSCFIKKKFCTFSVDCSKDNLIRSETRPEDPPKRIGKEYKDHITHRLAYSPVIFKLLNTNVDKSVVVPYAVCRSFSLPRPDGNVDSNDRAGDKRKKSNVGKISSDQQKDDETTSTTTTEDSSSVSDVSRSDSFELSSGSSHFERESALLSSSNQSKRHVDEFENSIKFAYTNRIDNYVDWYNKYMKIRAPLRLEEVVTMDSSEYDSYYADVLFNRENQMDNRVNYDAIDVRLIDTTMKLVSSGALIRIKHWRNHVECSIGPDIRLLTTNDNDGHRDDGLVFDHVRIQRLYDAELRINNFISHYPGMDQPRFRSLCDRSTVNVPVVDNADDILLHPRRSVMDTVVILDSDRLHRFSPQIYCTNPNVANSIRLILENQYVHSPSEPADMQLVRYVVRLYGLYALRYHGFARYLRVPKDPMKFFSETFLRNLFSAVRGKSGTAYKSCIRVVSPERIVRCVLAPKTVFGKILLFGVKVENYDTFRKNLLACVRENFNFFPASFVFISGRNRCWLPVKITGSSKKNRVTGNEFPPPSPPSSVIAHVASSTHRESTPREETSPGKGVKRKSETIEESESIAASEIDAIQVEEFESVVRESPAPKRLATRERETRVQSEVEVASTIVASSPSASLAQSFTVDQTNLIVKYAVENYDRVNSFRLWSKFYDDNRNLFVDSTGHKIYEYLRRLCLGDFGTLQTLCNNDLDLANALRDKIRQKKK